MRIYKWTKGVINLDLIPCFWYDEDDCVIQAYSPSTPEGEEFTVLQLPIDYTMSPDTRLKVAHKIMEYLLETQYTTEDELYEMAERLLKLEVAEKED